MTQKIKDLNFQYGQRLSPMGGPCLFAHADSHDTSNITWLSDLIRQQAEPDDIVHMLRIIDDYLSNKKVKCMVETRIVKAVRQRLFEKIVQ